MNLNKTAGVAAITLAAALVAGQALAASDNGNSGAKVGKGGFMLNVIAYVNCPAGDFTDSNRHHIAVQANFSMDQNGNPVQTLVKTNTIKLTSSGVDGGFQVIDGNACANRGKDGAELMLPITTANCDADCPVDSPSFTQYTVHVRMVGQPGGAIDVSSCALEPDDGDPETEEYILCSTESVVEVRETGKGKTQFTDYTKELLTLCLDTDDVEGCDTRLPLFDPSLEYYFWQWNAQGRAHAQLVFKPVQ